MLRDRYGYLWIGTERGVVKYNGYTFKLFDASNGLPDPDVWDFFEDSKGRIWLSRISYEFGYILNDEYHKVHAARKTPFLFYPRYIRETKDEIIFLSRYKNDLYLCRVTNDTLHTR
ncbi:MAG: hypothetical protein K8F30_09025, partial [Taibaiella sp.]|nr:hypothetical protein [Taibaiella sp.]